MSHRSIELDRLDGCAIYAPAWPCSDF